MGFCIHSRPVPEFCVFGGTTWEPYEARYIVASSSCMIGVSFESNIMAGMYYTRVIIHRHWHYDFSKAIVVLIEVLDRDQACSISVVFYNVVANDVVSALQPFHNILIVVSCCARLVTYLWNNIESYSDGQTCFEDEMSSHLLINRIIYPQIQSSI